MKNVKSYIFIVLLFGIKIGVSQVLNCQHAKAAQTYSLYYSPENHRSDTIDVLKYTIFLDSINYTTQSISAHTKVKFAPKINTQNHICLDLLELTVDSVKYLNQQLSYSYNDTLLLIHLLSPVSITDTLEIDVFYHGKPQGDPAGWGGFYFSGNYAYNLGVGFGASPHNYGRVWYPCFDNFVEHSKYEFHISTDTLKTSYCNGVLLSDTKTGNKRTRVWAINEEIVSYLASVSIADYTQVNWAVQAANGTLPIILAAVPSDTSTLKNGFIHLPNAILGFENYFGPYVWNRVGYCLVPFNSGAMEHVTNISYPRAAIGNMQYEWDLMAHELSHHWWGDLVTCETQEDMWLNEGMATYCESLFLEYVYGYQNYIDLVRNVHDDIVKYAHLREGGFRAISGIPHDYTYGDHVYRKGADVAHTLRTYMGDAAFFNGLKYITQQKAFQNMNSIEFRDLLQVSSGQNLTDFFNDWVFHPGWPHFSIDSVKTTGTTAPYTSVVYVKQKLFGAPAYYQNVPLEITFMDHQWQKEIKPINMSGPGATFTIQTNVKPVFVGINEDAKISDAKSSEAKIIKTNATVTYNIGRASLLVSDKGADSSYIYIEHHFAEPDPIKDVSKQYRLNTQHYWKIDGILSQGFSSKLRLNLDGNKTTSGNSYLDTCLTTVTNDSVIVLYRKGPADDWTEVSKYTRLKVGNKGGVYTIDTLKLGEYVFANGKSHVLAGIEEQEKENMHLKVFPNPAHDFVEIQLENITLNGSEYIQWIDVTGKAMTKQKINSNHEVIQTKTFSKGIYFIEFFRDGKKSETHKILIQ